MNTFSKYFAAILLFSCLAQAKEAKSPEKRKPARANADCIGPIEEKAKAISKVIFGGDQFHPHATEFTNGAIGETNYIVYVGDAQAVYDVYTIRVDNRCQIKGLTLQPRSN